MLNCASPFFLGGEVAFDLKNDGPTLTGARATFSINLNFPPNQTVLPNGQVVWEQNCTINGKKTFPVIAIMLWIRGITVYYASIYEKLDSNHHTF